MRVSGNFFNILRPFYILIVYQYSIAVFGSMYRVKLSVVLFDRFRTIFIHTSTNCIQQYYDIKLIVMKIKYEVPIAISTLIKYFYFEIHCTPTISFHIIFWTFWNCITYFESSAKNVSNTHFKQSFSSLDIFIPAQCNVILVGIILLVNNIIQYIINAFYREQIEAKTENIFMVWN